VGRVESAIQRDIIAYLRGCGSTYVINIGGGASSAKGTPDLVCCHRGVFLGFEVKRPDGSYGLTEPQAIRIRQITKAGGHAFLVVSVREVADIIHAIDERTA